MGSPNDVTDNNPLNSSVQNKKEENINQSEIEGEVLAENEENINLLEAKDTENSSDVEEMDEEIKKIFDILDEENTALSPDEKEVNDKFFEALLKGDYKEMYKIINETPAKSANNLDKSEKTLSNNEDTTSSNEFDEDTDKDKEISIEPVNKKDELKKDIKLTGEKKEKFKIITTNLKNIGKLIDIKINKTKEELKINTEKIGKNWKKLSEKIKKLNSLSINSKEFSDILSSMTKDFKEMFEKDKGTEKVRQ